MDLIRKIPKKFNKKFGNKVINNQYFRRKTGLHTLYVFEKTFAIKQQYLMHHQFNTTYKLYLNPHE